MGLRVLATGTTGYIGGRLVPRLIERGHQVRCIARDAGRLSDRRWGNVEVIEGDVYIGTANPARLVLLSSDYASEGTYVSGLIDAGQPAKWGKLQIDADVPRGCKVLVASRSGNVKDVNDPTFSEWTEQAEIVEPIQLRCPLGRFCQYKLTLQTPEGAQTYRVVGVGLDYLNAKLATAYISQENLERDFHQTADLLLMAEMTDGADATATRRAPPSSTLPSASPPSPTAASSWRTRATTAYVA